jgi:hypothetical protein
MMCSVDRYLPALGVCVAWTLSLSACEDMGNDPLAMAVAPETHGAVLLSDGLPTAPELFSEHDLVGQGGEELNGWWDSWDLDRRDGRRIRTELYPSLAGRLFPYLLEDGVADLLARNEKSLRAVQSAEILLVAKAVEAATEHAWHLHNLAVSALERGRGELALVHAFASADAIREVSPEQVAGALLHQAREALRRNKDAESYSEEELIRIRRLTGGAEQALEAGDYPRAIRRAYYACQLLGAGPG